MTAVKYEDMSDFDKAVFDRKRRSREADQKDVAEGRATAAEVNARNSIAKPPTINSERAKAGIPPLPEPFRRHRPYMERTCVVCDVYQTKAQHTGWTPCRCST